MDSSVDDPIGPGYRSRNNEAFGWLMSKPELSSDSEAVKVVKVFGKMPPFSSRCFFFEGVAPASSVKLPLDMLISDLSAMAAEHLVGLPLPNFPSRMLVRGVVPADDRLIWSRKLKPTRGCSKEESADDDT